MHYIVCVLLVLLGSSRGFAVSPVDDFLPSSAGFFSSSEDIAKTRILNSAFQLSQSGKKDVPLVEIVYPSGIFVKPPFVVRLIQIDGFDLTKDKYKYRLEVKRLLDVKKSIIEVSSLDVKESFAQSFYSVWTWALRSTRYSPPNGSAIGLLDALHSCFVVGEGRYEGWMPIEIEDGGKLEIMGNVAVDISLWCESKGRDLKAKVRFEKNLSELKRRADEKKVDKGSR